MPSGFEIVEYEVFSFGFEVSHVRFIDALFIIICDRHNVFGLFPYIGPALEVSSGVFAHTKCQ